MSDHSNSPIPSSQEGADDDLDQIAKCNPFDALQSWYRSASDREPADPNAMTLATVDASGMPNARIVLMKGIDEAGKPDRGVLFYTNVESAKGQELLSVARAACVFHWKSLERQVRLRGLVTPVSAPEADAYFASRPRDSRIGAWASQQSRPLASREALTEAVADFDAKYRDEDVPRPPHWSGYRLTPLEIEFWCARPFRLHDRAVFRRQSPEHEWQVARLYP
jgi:pyridoxamine 5'-phosphate oxidase